MANAVWQATIVDQSGNVLPGAEIAVVNEATGLPAPLFTTRTGTSKSNPFFADSSGFAQFYAAPGLYRITATSAGTGTTMTWRNVRLVDVATTAEAIAGTAGVLPDAAGVKAHVDSRVTQGGADTTLGRLLKVGDALVRVVNNHNKNANVFNAQNFSEDSYNNRANCNLHIQSNNNALTFLVSGAENQRIAIIQSGHESPTWASAVGMLRLNPFGGAVTINGFNPRHTGNTTVDANGFIKAASPIVKLHSDRIEKNDDFSADFERIGTGHYVIKNTLGFAQEGWYIETPKDANGNIKVFVDFEDNDGDITVKTYEPDYSTGRATAGTPADIPKGRWIDLRLHELPPEPNPEENAE